MMVCDPQEARFVQLFLTTGFDAKSAAKAAGFVSPNILKSLGWLAPESKHYRPHMHKYMIDCIQQLPVDGPAIAAKAIAELEKIAFSNPADFLTPNAHGQLGINLTPEMMDDPKMKDQLAAVQYLNIDTKYNKHMEVSLVRVSVRLHDKIRALTALSHLTGVSGVAKMQPSTGLPESYRK